MRPFFSVLNNYFLMYYFDLNSSEASKSKTTEKNLTKSKSAENGSEDKAKGDEGINWVGGSDTSKCFPPKPTATADEVRISCRKLLANALKGEHIYISNSLCFRYVGLVLDSI